MTPKPLIAGCMVALVLSSSAASQEDWRRVQIDEAQAREELAACAASWSDAAEWNRRAASIRAGIMHAAGLDPLPRRTPLQPIMGESRRHDGYSVTNVAFESIPGFFVTGNLYTPLGRNGPFPAVLCPHGHFQPTADDAEGRRRASMQTRCGTLARMGAVAFAYDMVGWGESTQVAQHDHGDVLTLQLWNSMRAVDFLQSLEEVDAARIAITGASGGGTQSFLLASVDDRIACSVPVVMVSAHFFGGCRCESGRPIHHGDDYSTNNAEIAAMCAPRSQLIISCGGDWTANTPEVELPYIRSVYESLSAADAVANVHFADEQHDYGPSKRAAMYRFVAKQFNLDLAEVTNLDGTIEEPAIIIEQRDVLCVFSDESPRPDDAPVGIAAVMERLRALQSIER